MLKPHVRPRQQEPKPNSKKTKPKPKKLNRKPQRQKVKILRLKNNRLILLAVAGCFGWLIWQGQNHWSSTAKKQESVKVESPLANLRLLAPVARSSQLKLISNSPAVSRNSSSQGNKDQLRARYLLAADSIQQQQGKLALKYLRGLGAEYPLLQPQILFKIAQAYQLNNQHGAAQKTLNYLIQNYPQSPVAANALSLLAGGSSKHEARLIQKFPYHPLTQKLARQRLSKNPDQFQLLLLLAKYSRDSNLNKIRDRLVLEYPEKLTSEDWETIADGYWQEEEHRKAADAYGYAPVTPRNLYRVARGFHRNGNIDTAKRAYQRLLREYHDAREAGEALLYLASISSGDEAVVYLEKAIIKFPEVAPQAYRSKAIVHEKFNKNAKADKARDDLLNKYGDTASAAEYRWKTAQQLANSGSKEDAWTWMQPLVKSNLELDIAPKALYQTAKWAIELDKPEAAKKTFIKIIRLYPQSYWAWRSAVKLDWKVGDFDQLRPLSPPLDLTAPYSPLPISSPALQELYFLGQYHDAWLLMQAEIEDHQQPSVNEQFAEGLLKLELGGYSQGMQQIWDLTKRESPEEKEQWKTLRQTTAYWHGLFPFPYQDKILSYARQEQINPLLVLSVMRKESTFNPEIDSVVGAVGLMQIVPPTADWVAQQINLPNYSLTDPEDNIEIGTWYLKHNHHRYQDDSLLAVASYNAGTGNVSEWLTNYGVKDRDRFVEKIPFPETKDYVEGVFGNYWNYLRLYNPEIRQKVNQLSRR